MNRAVYASLTIFCLLSVSSMAGFIQVVKADGGSVYIRADGSIDPPTAPISTIDNVTYIFTGNINDSVVVERDNIVVDGAGYTVKGTGIIWSPQTGVDLTGRSNVTIKNMNIEAFGGQGIIGEASAPDQWGIRYYSSYNRIIRNNITSCGYGIYFTSSHDNIISGNNITSNYYDGIRLWHSNLNSIIGNNITANGGDGVQFESSSNITISGNTIADCSRGVNIMWQKLEFACVNNTISGNTFINDGLRTEGSYSNVVTDNLVNGKPLVYLENVSDYSVVGDAGQVILVDCKGINVENLTLSNTDFGVELWGTRGTSIRGCTIANITLIGIDLEGACDNTVGMNNIVSSRLGIYFDYSSGNNVIYHNSFANNSQQVGISAISPPAWPNIWDDGYPSGGNYWSDYNGTDADQDGIGDIQYIIDAKNADRYPLTGMYSSFEVWVPPYPAGGFENVDVIANFTILDLDLYVWLTSPNQYLQPGQPFLSLAPVQGQNMTAGFCRMTVPNNILNTSEYTVLMDLTPISVKKLFGSNSTHTILYFVFTPSEHNEIYIVPEFPSFLILPLFSMATLLAVIACKRKHTSLLDKG